MCERGRGRDLVERWRRQDEERAIAAGKRFRMRWLLGTRWHGPMYFETLAAAEAHRDRQIAESRIDFPPDDWAVRPGRAKKFCPHLEGYDGHAWQAIPGSHRECVFRVEYDV